MDFEENQMVHNDAKQAGKTGKHDHLKPGMIEPPDAGVNPSINKQILKCSDDRLDVVKA